MKTVQQKDVATQFQPAAERTAPDREALATVTDLRPEAAVQRKLQQQTAAPAQRRKNDTGLPDNLKSGIENLSGIAMDDVRVHRNSDKPAQLNAHAYAQGTDIHLAAGQEKHLPHEAWHVVQQKQGRVKPTMQMKGKVAINDDAGLEREADVMGGKALRAKAGIHQLKRSGVERAEIQLVKDESLRPGTDSSMGALRALTIELLKELKKKGVDWAKKYGDQGKEKARGKTEQVLSGEEAEKTDYIAEVRREALKRYWDSLSSSEKIELVRDAGGLVVQGARLLVSAGVEAASAAASSDGSSMAKGKKKASSQSESSSSGSGGLFSFLGALGGSTPTVSGSWLKELTADDLKTLYEAYQKKKEVMDKIEEYKQKIIDKSGELGEFAGSAVGSFINEVEFIKTVGEQRTSFLIARGQYQALRDTLKENDDISYYSEEMDALSDALFNPNGPAMVYILGSLTKEGRDRYPEICNIALSNLEGSGMGRRVKAGVMDLGKGAVSAARGFFGAQDPELGPAQTQLVAKLRGILGADWAKVTKYKSKPGGIKEIAKALPGGQADAETVLESAARRAAGEADRASSNRDRDTTQWFYDTLKNLKPKDKGSVQEALSILKIIEHRLR